MTGKLGAGYLLTDDVDILEAVNVPEFEFLDSDYELPLSAILARTGLKPPYALRIVNNVIKCNGTIDVDNITIDGGRGLIIVKPY